MFKGAILGFDREAAELYGPALLDAEHFLGIQAVACLGPGEEQNAAVFPEARIYHSLEELFSGETDLDFAVITSAPGQRARCARRALEHRLHALCRPPFCFSTTEFDEIRQAAERNRRVVYSAQPWEHSHTWRTLSEITDQQLPGETRRAEIQLLCPGPGREPAYGVTAGLGWQAFSVLLGLVRRPPLAMTARLGLDAAWSPDTAEDEASFQLHFSGATGIVHLSAAAHAARFAVRLTGEKGLVELRGNRLFLDIAGHTPETVTLEDDLAEGFERRDWLLSELLNFRKEMEGPDRPRAGLKNSRYCAKLLRNAGYSASVNSSAVPL